MARKLRIEYAGAIYHVMNRGDRRELIFMDDADRQRFVDTLGEVCAKTGWQVHAYVLMPNHFHLVVETPQPNLVAGMKWLLGTYTSRFNRRHKLFGHLFSGRYKSLIVDGSGSGYLKSVGDYVHLNPARAKLVAADAPLRSFAWSSWPAYLLVRAKRPAWLRVDRLLGEWGMPEDSPAGRQRLEQALEERRGTEEGEEFEPIRRGWCLGEETFREQLLTQMSERMGAEHYGEERAETAEALADLIIAEELKLGRWQEADLKTRPKGDSVKVALAARLRAETTMTVGWIAERLAMGTRGYLNHLLYRRRRLGGE
jgi:REP element-mobilizing transposase RayT